jgi:3-oxoacyl-[acyl-carrier protein] reductase
MLDFSEQIVIVTGASRGIGRTMATLFASRGAHVMCIATSENSVKDTVEAITASGGKAQGFGCDISDAEQVQAVVDKIVAEHGAPSVLINNAGLTKDTLLLRMSEDDWDRVIDVNLKGAFLFVRACTKSMMKARYGRIINISSVVGLHGAAGQVNYAASKAGLVGMTYSLAKELGSRNITCNVIAPGFIETDMTKDLQEDFKAHVQKTAPAGRLGTPEDIAYPVLFLASKEAAYITGQVLTVDGGLMI